MTARTALAALATSLASAYVSGRPSFARPRARPVDLVATASSAPLGPAAAFSAAAPFAPAAAFAPSGSSGQAIALVRDPRPPRKHV